MLKKLEKNKDILDKILISFNDSQTSMIHFEPRRKASIYTSFIAIFIITAYNVLRLGLDFQLIQSLKTAGFILALLNFPLLFIETIAIKSRIKIFQDEYGYIFIFLIASCLIGIASIEGGYFFIALGCLSFFRNIFLYSKVINKQEIISFIFLTIISTWLSITVWRGDYLHPMLLERLPFNDQIPIDTIYHVSLSQMIKTYLIPSTGLNGIPFTPYHFGSHFIFAGLSKILNIHLFTFYQLSYPAIFLPLLIKVFWGVPIVWTERSNTETQYKFGFWFWLIICTACIGVFPIQTILAKAGMEIPALIVSESYDLSITFLFLITNILLFNYQYEKGIVTFKLSALSLILLLIFILGLTKNSTLAICDIIVFYTFFRLKFYKQKRLVLFGALIVLLSILCIIITVDPESGDGSFELFHFYKHNIQIGYYRFIIVCYFWSLLLMILCTTIIFINKKNNSSQQNIFYRVLIGSVLLISTLGALPGLFLKIAGGSAGYFMDVQIWFSVCFLLVILPDIFRVGAILIQRIDKSYIRIIIIIAILIPISYAGIISQDNFRKSVIRFVEHNLEDKKTICKDTTIVTTKLTFIEKLTHINDLNLRLHDCLSKNQNYTILTQLYGLDTISTKEKSHSMLVLGNIHDLTQYYVCYKYFFFFPALTGIAIKNGFVFENCYGKNYGFEYYKRADLQFNRNIPNPSKDIMIEIKSGSVILHPALNKKN
jgi:hypothetical protein